MSDTRKALMVAHEALKLAAITKRADGTYLDSDCRFNTAITWVRTALAQLERDREADRTRFTDPAFNQWLDEAISDAGHTVWDAVGDVQAAWQGWESRPFYVKNPVPLSM